MTDFASLSLRYSGDRLSVLDQTLLPHKEEWAECDTIDTFIDLIQRLSIRGAPLIGVSSSLFLATLCNNGIDKPAFLDAAERVKAARPTAVNLMNNIASLLQVAAQDNWRQAVINEAERLYREDVELCDKMAAHGAELVNKGDRILTHCNTGGLATVGVGTALGVIAKSASLGKQVSVWVDETRPLLQGGRLTAWECAKLGIPYQLICDNMAAMLMQQGKVDKIFVGSDRIATNGDFANKIGTYSLAVLAQYHKVPFYVVAPQTTVDPECASGQHIPIEMRHDDEVKGVNTSQGRVCWAPEDAETFNPAFDVTPAELVSGWVLDTGVYRSADIANNNWWLG